MVGWVVRLVGWLVGWLVEMCAYIHIFFSVSKG